MTAVLVVGVPRSGTSWIGRVLGSTPGARYLSEPDNHEHAPFALRAKRGLPGRFYPWPEPPAPTGDYARLWQTALLEAGRQAPLARARCRVARRLLRGASASELVRTISAPAESPPRLRLSTLLAVPERAPAPAAHLVVKSVHAQLAVGWIAARFPVEVIVVLRRPLNVLSSWKELGWVAQSGVLDELGLAEAARLERELEVPPYRAGSPLEEAAQLIGLLSAALLRAARDRPTWRVVWHEELCERPHERFRTLARAVGLAWDDRVERLLDDLDRPGSGFETTRLAATLADVWQTRLTAEEAAAAAAVLERFDLDSAERH